MNYSSKYYKMAALADIRNGHPFRRKVEHDPAGTTAVIETRHIPPLIEGEPLNCHKTSLPDLPKSSELQPGDILLKSRYAPYRAAVLPSLTQPTIAASPITILRIKTKGLLPEYLTWWLNSQAAQNYFASRERGTVVKMIAKSAVADMKIPVPSLEEQRKITALSKLIEKEEGLVEQLTQLRKKLLEAHTLKQYAA